MNSHILVLLRSEQLPTGRTGILKNDKMVKRVASFREFRCRSNCVKNCGEFSSGVSLDLQHACAAHCEMSCCL